ncbi:MAG: gfo/Idh/MocA family oxidoreductase, partial [Alphaproteobacteria bacterium]
MVRDGRLRVACLGAGYFARYHIDAWERIEGAQIVAVIDSDIAKAQATGHPAFADLSAALATAAPDLLD